MKYLAFTMAWLFLSVTVGAVFGKFARVGRNKE